MPKFFQSRLFQTARNSRGQGLIEYLIIVALIAVATIGVMRYVGEAVNARFATIGKALSGDRKVYDASLDENLLKKRDMGDFMNGVASDNNHGGGSSSGGRSASGM